MEQLSNMYVDIDRFEVKLIKFSTLMFVLIVTEKRLYEHLALMKSVPNLNNYVNR